MFLFILNTKPDSFQMKLFVKDFRPEWDLKADLCDTCPVSRQLSYQANWELVCLYNSYSSSTGNSVCLFLSRIYEFIIHEIFLRVRDWSKRVTWANIPQLKLGNIRGYSPIFKSDG